MLEQLLQRIRANDPSLTKIDLHCKKIGDAGAQALAEALKTNTSVKKLELAWTNIADAGAQALAEALKTNTSVTAIDLRENYLGDAGAQALAEALKINTSVTTIDLGNINIGDAGVQALAEAFKINTVVTEINLGLNNIGDAGAQALANALKTNTSVREIDLGRNNIGAAGVQALAEALKTNTSVTKIVLQDNKIGDGYQALAEALKTNTSVTWIDLKHNNIRAADAQALAEALKTNTSVTTIDMSENNLGDAGAQALAEALKTNTAATKISLSKNNIGNNGTQALAKALETNNSVTWINLYNNNIGDKGAQVLAEALKTNTSVTTIDLSENDIGDAGAQALAEALKANTSVTTINLSENDIGDAGAQALAEALKTNTSVTTINLSENNLGDAGAQALAEALKINTAVTTINLVYTNIGYDGAGALVEALKSNTSVTKIDLDLYLLQGDVETQLDEYLYRNRTNAEKLIHAVQNNDSTAVKELLAGGVSVNYQDEVDKTALHYAIQQGRLEIVYLLLNSPQLSKKKTTSSLVNEFSNENGNTLLHQAVLFTENNREMAHKLIERLLAFGAKRYVKNHAGLYPFQLCIPATTEENPELAIIRNLLKPTPAEQLFIDRIVNNPHIKLLIEKFSKTLVAMDDLMVTLRSDKTKQKYQLPGDLVVRLLFEELQLFRTHIEQNDFDCEEESAWEQFLATCLSNYENMTNNLSASQVSHQPEVLTDNESQLLKELILKFQQMNQAIFAGLQGSTHRDEMIQEVCIPREWVKEYELSLAETQTNKKRKRETEDSSAEGTLPVDDAEELSAKRQKTDVVSVQDLEKKILKLEQNLVLSQTEITELKQKLAKAETAKQSENTSSHSVAFFPTLQK